MTCALPQPAVGRGVEPATHETGVLFGAQGSPTAVRGPSGDFVVWPSMWAGMAGTTVTLDLQVSRAMPLTCGERTMMEPTLAANGGVLLVVGLVPTAGTFDLFGRRFTSEGQPIDADCLRLSDDPAEESHAAITSAGDGFLVLWSTGHNGVVSGVRVGAGGEVQALAALSTRSTGEAPALATNGTEVLAAWTEAVPMPNSSPVPQLFLAFLNPDGSVLRPPVFFKTVSSGGDAPVVASNGADFAVAWTDFGDTFWDGTNQYITARVRATRVTAAGVVLDPGGIKLSARPIATDSVVQTKLALLFDGDAYQATWIDSVWSQFDVNTLRGSRLRVDGTLTDLDVELATNIQYGRTSLVPGTVYYSQHGEIWRQALGLAGALPPKTRVSRGENSQHAPGLSVSAGRVLSLWAESRTTDLNSAPAVTALLGRRFDHALVPVEPTPVVLVPSLEFGWSAVASDGTNHLVVWRDGATDIRGLLVADDPSRPLNSPITLASADSAGFPRVCFDGVRWQVWFTVGLQGAVVRLARDGTGLEGPFMAGEGTALFVEGDRCVAVVLVGGVPTQLTLQEDGTFQSQALGEALPAGARPLAASSGGRLFLAYEWETAAGHGMSWSVFDSGGSRVGAGGPISIRGSVLQRVVGTTSGFLVFSSSGVTVSATRYTLDGARLGPAVALDGAWLDFTTAVLSADSLVLARTRTDDHRLSQRLEVSLLSSRAVGAGCMADDECWSGVCGHDAL